MIKPSTFCLAGIELDVFGLGQLPEDAADVALLFLLHGRMGRRQEMASAAQRIISEAKSRLPLVVVTLDQRNHGSRSVGVNRNLGWREKLGVHPADPQANGVEITNASSALDMVSTFSGTVSDIQHLSTFLPSLLFPSGERKISRWIVSGVSLGGHATWLAARDPRFQYLAPIIGSPSMLTLLSHRARTSKPPIELKPPLWPASLVDWLQQNDPDQFDDSLWTDKKILVLSGGRDQLVPYEQGGSEALVARLQSQRRAVEVFVDRNAGHELSSDMLTKLVDWLNRVALQ